MDSEDASLYHQAQLRPMTKREGNMPRPLDRESLARLGAGESTAAVAAAQGISPGEFDARWKATVAARVPPMTGERLAAVLASVEIERDQWGVPHIYAENDHDVDFGLGYAMAQDRLFQLDYLRRKGLGRLAEIL